MKRPKSASQQAWEAARDLIKAAERGDLDAVRAGLDAGVPVDAVAFAPQNWTALMYAASRGDLAMVDLLLERGADPDYRDLDSFGPLALARDPATALKLLDRGATCDDSDLSYMTSRGRAAVARKVRAYRKARPAPG